MSVSGDILLILAIILSEIDFAGNSPLIRNPQRARRHVTRKLVAG